MPTDQLRVVGAGKVSKRRLGGDLAMRNDLITRNPSEFVTQMVKLVKPASPYLVFTNLFGTTEDIYNQDRKLFDVQTSSIGAEFIRIKEEIEEKRPFYVIDNSKVPETLYAGQPFEVTLDYAVLDEGEQVKLWDTRTILMTVSRQSNSIGNVIVTFVMVGQVGETASGSLLGVGKPVHWGYGNSKGEGSQTGNHIPMNGKKSREFVAPTVITRYDWRETGSWMSDEVFKFDVSTTMNGGETQEIGVNLPVQMFKEALGSVENMIMDSRSNFDPATMEINNFGAQQPYPLLPTYPGIFQQLDQAVVQYSFPAKAAYITNLNRIESIQRQITQIFGKVDVFVVCRNGGAQWVRDAIRQGGIEKYKVQLTREIPASGKVDIGFGISSLITDAGTVHIYDMTGSFQNNGDFKTFSYNGVKGPDNSRDIYFIPVKIKDGRIRSFTYFSKSGKNRNHQQVDRGFVFGRTRGLTGEGNGLTGAQLMSMQENALTDMMNNSNYDINSPVDGNQYHMLFEGLPYIDITGIIKARLTD